MHHKRSKLLSSKPDEDPPSPGAVSVQVSLTRQPPTVLLQGQSSRLRFGILLLSTKQSGEAGEFEKIKDVSLSYIHEFINEQLKKSCVLSICEVFVKTSASKHGLLLLQGQSSKSGAVCKSPNKVSKTAGHKPSPHQGSRLKVEICRSFYCEPS